MLPKTKSVQQRFDVSDYFAENGLEFARKGPTPNTAIVILPTGEEKTFNVAKFMADEGLSQEQIETVPVDFNTPDKPLQVSPLDHKERFKLSDDRIPENIKYLQKTYEDVRHTEEQGIVVKKGGVWHKVDPDGLGIKDAWRASKNLSEFISKVREEANSDIADVAPALTNIASVAAGGTVGTAIGGPIGGLVGAGLGGLASGIARTSLGRYFGTYSATPEERIEDISIEGLLALGGQSLNVPGVRATLGQFVKAGTNLGKKLTGGSKSLVAQVFGELTRKGETAMHTLMERAPEVGGRMRAFMQNARGPAEGIAAGQGRVVRQTGELLREVPIAFARQTKTAINAVMTLAEKHGAKLDLNEAYTGFRTLIQAEGLGQFVQEKGKWVFKAFDEDQVARYAQQGIKARALSSEQVAAVRGLSQQVAAISKAGVVTGGRGVKALLEFKNVVSNFADNVFKKDDESLRQVMTVAKKGWNDSIVALLDKTPEVGAKYRGFMQWYGRYADSVDAARWAVRNNKVDVYAKQMMKEENQLAVRNLMMELKRNPKTSLYGKASEQLKLIELLGEGGLHIYDDMILSNTATKFLTWSPKFDLGRALVAPLASPKLVAKTTQTASTAIKASQMGLDFLKELALKKQTDNLLRNDTALAAFLRTVPNALRQGEEQKNELLQRGGVTEGAE